MRQMSPDELEARVSDAIRKSRFAPRFERVSLESDELDDDQEFIRVLVQLTDLDQMSDDDVDSLVSSIEREITQVDDRFPSVRLTQQ